MIKQEKNVWLTATLEDMITYCRLNGLDRSRSILLEAHTIMVSEIILESFLDASRTNTTDRYS